MSRSRFVKILPLLLLALLVAASIPGFVYDPMSDQRVSSSDVVWLLGFLAFPLVGVLLARRFPSNAVGWLFILGPMLIVSGVASFEYAEATNTPGFQAVGENLFSLGLVVVAAAMLVFPDGRYPTRFFAAVHLMLLIGLLVVTSESVDGALLGGLAVLTVAGFVYRLVTGGSDTRRQMKPLLFVLALALTSFFLVSPLLPDTSDSSVEVAGWVAWMEVAFALVVSVGVPAAIAVSVTRYRLYEMDRIVSRTISYGLIVLVLALVFAAGAVWVPQALGLEDPLFVAASTLLVAALFNPLRRRFQLMVDRRFNRSKYDAEQVADRFSGSLRDQIDAADLLDSWVAVVSETMHPREIAVWVKSA